DRPPKSPCFPSTTLFRSARPPLRDLQQRPARAALRVQLLRAQLGGGPRAALGAVRLHERVVRAGSRRQPQRGAGGDRARGGAARSEEHTSELQSREKLV